MDFISRLTRGIGHVISQNTNNNQNTSSQNPDPQFDDEDEALQRAIEESKRDFVKPNSLQPSLETKNSLKQNDIDAITEKQFEEIWSLVYNKEQLTQVLENLPGVDPNNPIFSEFW